MLSKWFLVCAWGVLAAAEWDRCTTIAVGKNASTTGAAMTTHASDCSTCDFRIGKVPQQEHAPGSVREIVQFRLEYPRYVGEGRGDAYKLANVDRSIFRWTNSPAIGSIPQVNKTYGYISGLYAIMNEHQVAMGECTCSGRLISIPVSAGGKALFDISELSHVAMERSTSAREAIQLMGSLAEQYGYYGAVWSGPMAYFESGETLTVTDPQEAWVFHIHPDDSGASAVWVAQRVPDNHIAAVANQFIIHHVNLTDKDNFMGSSNIIDVAIRAKLYNPEVDGEFDFTKAYSHPLVPDQYYATRRQWRVLTRANPKLELSPYTDEFGTTYPFSTEVATKISPLDLMAYQRDHYEGTIFDLTQGPAAGPYGNPDRYDINGNGNMTRATALTGHFERAISIFRASYSFVSVLHPTEPTAATLWFGPYAPHATTYIPVYAYANQVPEQLSRGSLHRYDPSTLYWACALVGNWMTRFYMYISPLVKETQQGFEFATYANQNAIQFQAQSLLQTQGDSALRSFLTTQSQAVATSAHELVSRLFVNLVTRFHDGYDMAQNSTDGTIMHRSLFYPEWWLRRVGYFPLDESTTINPNRPTWIMRWTSLFGVFICGVSASLLCGYIGGRIYFARQRRGYIELQ